MHCLWLIRKQYFHFLQFVFMKKFFLLVSFSFIGLVAFSQQLSFSKGNIAPGKMSTARAYEDFISGGIKVVDEKGAEYSFVKADFKEKTTSGKTISISLDKPTFPEEQIGDIVRASQKGTTYTFTNVVVKDKQGKEHKIALVVYEFVGFQSGN